MSDPYVIDDGGTAEVVAVEAPTTDGSPPQALWVRVGPVYDGAAGEERREPGVWIQYQERHMAGPLFGPVLLTPAAWRALATAVEERLQRAELPRPRSRSQVRRLPGHGAR
jgi:hypothetical protein